MIQVDAPLKASQRDALRVAAKDQRRRMEDQAAMYIIDGLRRDGYLPTDTSTPMTAQPVQAVTHGG